MAANASDLLANLTEEDILKALGPKRDPLYIVVPITVIYVVIFVTGVIGNVSTCVVIARNKFMHTATNYYLFSLSISDLLLLLSGLPLEVYSIWSRYPYVFGEPFCVLRGLAAETSANATVLTITAFTVERYVAICHPFLAHTMSKLSRAVKFILIIWLFSLACAMPQALQFGEVQTPVGTQCAVKRVILDHSFELATFVFFVGPMTLISVLYALIGLRLRRSNLMTRGSGSNPASPANAALSKRGSSCRHHTGASSKRVLKMLVAVVVAFFLCWAPFHAQRLVAIWNPPDVKAGSSSPGSGQGALKLYEVVTYISGVLHYVSPSINPVLYNIMSNRFREAFKDTFNRCCGPPKREGRLYSALSRSQRRRYPCPESTSSATSIRDDICSVHTTGGRRVRMADKETTMTEFTVCLEPAAAPQLVRANTSRWRLSAWLGRASVPEVPQLQVPRAHSDISDSSLKDLDRPALADELALYLRPS